MRHPVSAISHWMGLVLMLYVFAIFWRLSRYDPLRQKSVGCFAACACFLYGISGTYHAILEPPWLIALLRNLDFSAIFLLIAGTWTPIFVLLPRRLRQWMWGILWTVTSLCIAGKWLMPAGSYTVTVGLYLLLAVVGLVPIRYLFCHLGWRGIALGAIGGLCYLIGGICDVLKKPILWPGVFHSHELLHFLDLAGTMMHVVLIYRYVIVREVPP